MHKAHILGKSGSWDISQNAFGQSDCKVFRSTMSLKQSVGKAWVLHVDTNLWKSTFDWKLMGKGIIKNEDCHLGHVTPKLAVSQKEINGIN